MSVDERADPGLLREALAAAIATEHRSWRQARHHEAEAQRWQRRLELAERRGAVDLAGVAARQARRQAGLAHAAALDFAEQQARVRLLKEEWRALDRPPLAEHDPATAMASTLEQRFTQIEQEAATDAQLQALKARLFSGSREESEGQP